MDLRGQSETLCVLGATGSSPVIKEAHMLVCVVECVLFRTNLGGTAGISPVPCLWDRSFLFFNPVYYGGYQYVHYVKAMAKERLKLKTYQYNNKNINEQENML